MTFTYHFWYTLSKVAARLLFSLRILHRERVIEEGPVILAANHQSYVDPPLVGVCSRRDVYFLARRTLLDLPLLGPLLPRLNVIAVDRDGNDMSALKTIIRLLRSGQGVVLFPEGTRSPDGRLRRGKAGIGLVIAKTRAPVQPVRILGSHDAFPRGTGRFSPVPITVVVGEPLRFTPEELDPASCGGDERVLYQRLSDRVMEAIAALAPAGGSGALPSAAPTGTMAGS